MNHKRLKKAEISVQRIVRKNSFSLAVWSILITAIICLIITFAVFLSNVSHFNNLCDISKTGPLGDTFNGLLGPFIAFLVALLTFLAFYIQYQANEQQKGIIRAQQKKDNIEKLETKFFEMIKLHRDNVSELSYTSYSRNSSKEETSHARKVFKVIFNDFKELQKELNHFFDNVNEKDIYKEEYLSDLKKNSTIRGRDIDLVLYAKLDIIYCILYFGLSSSDNKTIKYFFNKRYNTTFFEPILFFAALKPKEDSINWGNYKMFYNKDLEINYFIFKTKFDEIKGVANPRLIFIDKPHLKQYYECLDYYSKDYRKYYGGHQFRLGHYFRNLYQAVTLIDDSKLIDYRQKYLNIKLLRGQLSTFEQSIFYLNSISFLGRIWELENREHSEMAIDENNQLITKYNIIKNILNDEIMDGISVSAFYPLVTYEANFDEEKAKERAKLEMKYS